MFPLRTELPGVDARCYTAAQIADGIGGAIAAHLMFGLPIVSVIIYHNAQCETSRAATAIRRPP